MIKKNNLLDGKFFDEDDGEEYGAFLKHVDEDVQRSKNVVANHITSQYDEFLLEKEKKKEIERIKKEPLVDYVLSKDKNGFYDKKTLMRHSYRDILDMYNETKKKHENFFIKLYKTIFNINSEK
jgi:hypothetical protein